MTPQQVKALRLSRGHTQVIAAAVIGVHSFTWSRWECGVYPPDQSLLELYEIKTRQDARVKLDTTKRRV